MTTTDARVTDYERVAYRLLDALLDRDCTLEDIWGTIDHERTFQMIVQTVVSRRLGRVDVSDLTDQAAINRFINKLFAPSCIVDNVIGAYANPPGIRLLLDGLNDTERMLVIRFYGLNGHEPVGLDVLAMMIETNEKQALGQLNAAMEKVTLSFLQKRHPLY